MPSNLTRRVFQRLLSSRPLVIHRQLHGPTRPILRPRRARVAMPTTPVRTLMEKLQSILNPDANSRRRAYIDPGMEKMLELDKRIHLVARLPPKKELVAAFSAFVSQRLKLGRAIEDFHAVRLLQTLETVEKKQISDNSASIDVTSLKVALQALTMVPNQGYTKVHNKLARDIWDAKCARQESEQEGQTGDAPKATPEEIKRAPVLQSLIAILCHTGDALDARKTLETFGKQDESSLGKSRSRTKANSWATILMGFSKQNDEQELENTLEIMRQLDVKFSKNVARTLAVHYAQRNNVEKAKKWYELVELTKPNSLDGLNTFTPDETVYQTLLEFCLRNGEMKWGRSILSPTQEKFSTFNKWDAIFRASAATGRSVDEVDRMMEILARRADENQQSDLRPTIDTFNGLIRFALSKNDAYLAERYFGLIKDWNVQPNAETYTLQVEYRLGAGDLDGATAAYNGLQDELQYDPDQKNKLRDWNTINRVLQAVAAKPSSTQDSLSELISDIAHTGLGLSFETVIALTHFHLLRDEYGPCVELLDNYAPQFSMLQRSKLRDILVDFTMDPEADVGRSWEAYMIFHQVFDLETKRDIRTRTMLRFFARGRPDFGTHVFTQMSKHIRADTRPDRETYITAFEGIATAPDPDALEVIHNLLKLDTDVEPDTRLLNGLMLAYTATEMPVRALEFWHEISTSPEGPTYDSLRIAFRACEESPFGYRTAREIWEKLREADIEISMPLFTSFVACAARQRMFEDMEDAMRKAKEITGEKPDVQTVGAMFNACRGTATQDSIEQYIRNEYPQLWTALEAKGFEEDEFGWKLARGINRGLQA